MTTRFGKAQPDKQAIRTRVWDELEQHGAASEPGVAGYIPDFVGSEVAAQRLSEVGEWRHARMVKANPDRAQLPVRALALRQGKRVYMAAPRLAAEKPFVLLVPDRLEVPYEEAASHRVAVEVGLPVDVGDMEPVDLVVCGSVAVNSEGVRLGKGGGYSDLEMGMLVEAGLLTDATTIVTTVHGLQVLDEELPEDEHDFRVDVIATQQRVLRAARAVRPSGILWDRLSPEAIAAIPALSRRGSPPTGGETPLQGEHRRA